jgi:uncharacterized protein
MRIIGLISDTHSYLDPRVFEFFDSCDEIWHAGDIGNNQVIEQLQAFRPTKAVFGNIDDLDIRSQFPEDLVFEIENLKVLMTHIAGRPSTYNPRVRNLILLNQPNLLICGHSHILSVIKDRKRENLVFINAGAAGKQGFHKMRTLLKMTLDNGKITNLEVFELGKR